MATTIYSGWSSAWRPSGSSYDKKYRSFLTYTITTSSTQVVVKASSGVNINSSVAASFTGTLAATGYNTYSGSTSTAFGETKTKTIISTKTFTYKRGASAQTKTITAGVKSSQGSWTGQNMTKPLSVPVPALGSKTVSYDPNGGDGEIEPDIKYQGQTLKLDDGAGFTWANHKLLSWNTKEDGTGTSYPLGGNYTTDAEVTLYAQWELTAIEVDAKDSGEWFSGIIYAKVNGAWSAPKRGYVKINGSWEQIKKKEDAE